MCDERQITVQQPCSDDGCDDDDDVDDDDDDDAVFRLMRGSFAMNRASQG